MPVRTVFAPLMLSLVLRALEMEPDARCDPLHESISRPAMVNRGSYIGKAGFGTDDELVVLKERRELLKYEGRSLGYMLSIMST